MVEETLSPASWHKRLAEIVGALSFCVARRKVSREQLASWITTLEAIRCEMERMRGEPAPRSR
jgi:hypothetical protein